MSKKFQSLSAGLTDVNAFIAIVTTMLLKYNGNPIAKIKPELPKWYAQAKPLLAERPDLAAKFTSCYNVTSLGRACKAEQIDELALAMKDRAFIKFLNDSIKVTIPQITFIKTLASHALADTQERVDSSWEKIRTMVTSLGRPTLNVAFSGKVDKSGNAVAEKAGPVPSDVTKAASELAGLVKSVAGRSNCYLSISEKSALFASKPEVYQRYLALNKVVNKYAEEQIKKIIMASGEDRVSIDLIWKKLQQRGVQNNLPIGFTGGTLSVISNKLVAFTKEGAQMQVVPAGHVAMNPKYDPANPRVFVCGGVGTDRAHYRTLAMLAGRRGSHFENVREYTTNSADFRKKWLKDMMAFDPKKDHGRPDVTVVLAALVELLHITHQRIGGKGNATKGEETFGLSTLQVGHMTIKPTYITYSYTGKKLTTQESKFSIVGSPEAIKLGQIIRALVEERKDAKGKIIPAKGKNELVFTRRTATLDKPVPADAVRDYMKDSHGLKMGPHGFRHSVATEMARAILAKSKFKPGKATQKEVDAWVNAQMLSIGKLLHHRGTKGETVSTTARKSYIDPELMHDFYSKLGLRTIKDVPKHGQKDSGE